MKSCFLKSEKKRKIFSNTAANARVLAPAGRLSVVENAPPRTLIAHVSATDADLGSAGTVDCYVSSPDLRLEPLHAGAVAEYKLVAATTLDRELQARVRATLTCADRGRPTSRSADVPLDVEVRDQNDRSPEIASDLYQVQQQQQQQQQQPFNGL